jgi:tRNA-uridine 2-sulfurtransferase
MKTPMMPTELPVKPRKILVGMSGGVDSSVAAFLLQQQGWEVYGLSLLTDESTHGSIRDAEAISRQLGISWELFDLREKFRQQVVDNFISAYTSGQTPNPCVICNPLVKFNALLEVADRLGCEAVATGHYASIRRVGETGRLALAKTDAGLKDQTYFMYRLSQDQLAWIIFPLAGMDKPAVRAVAAQAGLIGSFGSDLAQKPDSQDCCFIPDGDYAHYIETALQKMGDPTMMQLTKPGIVINTSGHPIGTHKGLIHYTLGQRKGFQVQTTERLFVIDRDPVKNTLTVGPFSAVHKQEILVVDPVYSGLAAITDGERLEARIRNSAKEAPCKAFPLENDSIRVVFDQPVSAPAPGQSCVFYRDGLIMAGGVIA